MKDRVVTGVNLIATVDIPRAEEGVVALGDELALVRGGVSAQHCIFINVIGIRRATRDVFGRDAQIVEATFRGNNGIFIIKQQER